MGRADIIGSYMDRIRHELPASAEEVAEKVDTLAADMNFTLSARERQSLIERFATCEKQAQKATKKKASDN